MNRKSSIPLVVNRRKSGSLGFRNYMLGSQGSQDNEMPSVSRPSGMSYSQQNQSYRQSMMPMEAGPSSSRSSRLGYNGPRGKRSSSQEPPTLDKRRTFDVGGLFDQHCAAGLLLTPARSNASKSPGYSGLASVNRGSASVRRNSSKLHVISDASQKVKDPRPISDKNFQANAISKIQNFLRRSSPNLSNIKLKPLSNSTLVQVFNAIYRELDPTTQVTSSDYADKISNIIRNLGYPSNISKSSFVAVGSGHGGVQILAMLSWLVDCVEVMMTVNFESASFPTDSEEMRTQKSLCFTILEMYGNAKSGTPNFDQQEVDDIFAGAMGDTPEVEIELEERIESLKQEIAIIQDDPRKVEDEMKVQQLDIVEDRAQGMRQAIEADIGSAGTLKAKINTEKEAIKSLESDNNRVKDMCSEIGDRLERQPMKHTDRDRIIEECKQLNAEMKTQNEHLEMVHRLIGNFDLKITKLQTDIRSITHEVNEIVLEHTLANKFKWDHNPTHSNAKEYMVEAKNCWTKGVENMEFNNERDNQCLSKLQKDIDALNEASFALKDELDKLMHDCDQLDSKIIDDQGQARMAEQELKEKLDATKAKCLKFMKELNGMPKLEDVKAMTEKVISDTKKAKEDFAARKEFVEGYFFPNLLKLQAENAEELARECAKPFEEMGLNKNMGNKQ